MAGLLVFIVGLLIAFVATFPHHVLVGIIIASIPILATLFAGRVP